MYEFKVWAPRPQRVAVQVGGSVHAMHGPDDCGWWRIQVEAAKPGDDYGFLLDDDPTPYPDPRSMRQPHGVHGLSRIYDQHAFAWTRCALAGTATYRRRHLRAAHRHLHRGGHLRQRHRAAGLSRRAGHHPPRDHAGRVLPRRPWLGLRRRRALRRHRELRRSGRAQALRRRLSRQGPRGPPRRRLQPLRPRRQLHRQVRPLTSRRVTARRGATRSTSKRPAPIRSAASSATTL